MTTPSSQLSTDFDLEALLARVNRRLDELTSWKNQHGGPAGGASAQYPHPYQRVVVLDDLGSRWDEDGIFLAVTDVPSDENAIHIIREGYPGQGLLSGSLSGTEVVVSLQADSNDGQAILTQSLATLFLRSDWDDDTNVLAYLEAADAASHSTSVSVRPDSIQLIGNNTMNFAIFPLTTPNFQSGNGILYIANRLAAPTGNPSGGGFLYTESGALKYRGSGGTVSTVAPA